MLTKVRDCDLLIVVTSSTFLKRKDILRGKSHLIIRVGAGLIQFVYGSHLRLATGVTSSKIRIPPSFRAEKY